MRAFWLPLLTASLLLSCSEDNPVTPSNTSVEATGLGPALDLAAASDLTTITFSPDVELFLDPDTPPGEGEAFIEGPFIVSTFWMQEDLFSTHAHFHIFDGIGRPLDYEQHHEQGDLGRQGIRIRRLDGKNFNLESIEYRTRFEVTPFEIGTALPEAPTGSPTQVPNYRTIEIEGALVFTRLEIGMTNVPEVWITMRGNGDWDNIVLNSTVNPPYNFSGFFQPVENPTVATNTAKAGSAIPVKFKLDGDQGLDIFRAADPDAYPKLTLGACDAGALDVIETTTANPGGLSYDAASDTYTYVWKTQKAWAGKCGTFHLGLKDGSDHHALFMFK